MVTTRSEFTFVQTNKVFRRYLLASGSNPKDRAGNFAYVLITDSRTEATTTRGAREAGAAPMRVPDIITADRCVVLDTVESTNTQARRMLSETIMSDATRFPLYVLLANEQTGGRGRLGRTWVSGRNTSFLSSFVVRIPTALATGVTSGWLTTIAGIDAVESLRVIAREHGVDPSHIGLKWPNDLYWDDRKLGGILTELAAVHAGLTDDAIVIFGIGINLFLSDQPTRIATSLHRHVPGLPAYPVLRNELAQLIAQRLRVDVQHYCDGAQSSIPRFAKRVTALSCTVGRRVSAELPGGTRITGTAIAIRPDAALEIRTDDGDTVSVTAGDVGLIPQAIPGQEPPADVVTHAMPAHSLLVG